MMASVISPDSPASDHRLWLASASPRRVELLRQLGVAHKQRAAAIDESPRSGESAADYVARMAREKGQAVWRELSQELKELTHEIVLAADTTVHLAGTILGKPQDEADFTRMMQRLSGATHEVLSAVALVSATGEQVRLSVTQVRFKSLASTEIHAYWRTGEPHDKAGGYAIQGFGAAFIEHIAGSYSAVVGLPLLETAELLRQAGVPVWQAEGEV